MAETNARTGRHAIYVPNLSGTPDQVQRQADFAQAGHPAAGAITLEIDGETRQRGDLSEMIWSVPEIIGHLSRLFTLKPGDLIYTGTPSGVGPVSPGERLDGRIEGVGALSVTIE